MATLTKEIKLDIKIGSAPVQEFTGTLEEVVQKIEDVKAATKDFRDDAGKPVVIDVQVDGAQQSAKDIENLTAQLNQLKAAEKAQAAAANDVSASFADVYGDIQPLTARLGEAEDRLYELALAGKQTSKEYQDLLATTANYRRTQIETDLAVDAASQTLGQKLGGSLQAVAGAFAIAQGAAGLFGKENENIEKAILKTQQALALVQGIDAFRQGIPSLRAFAKDLLNLNVITRANTALTKVTALTMGLFSKSVNTTSNSFKLLKGAIAATGIGLLVIAIGELVANFDKIKAALSGTTEKQQAYNNVMKETLANSTAEIASLDSLYASSQDLTKSIDERRAAAIELQKTYPETFSNFTQEEILAGKSATAYQNLRNEIVATALAKAKQSQIDEKAVELAEQEAEQLAEIQRLRERQREAPEQRGSRVETYYGPGGGGSTVVDIPSKADIQKRIDEVQKEIDKGRKELGKYAEEIGAIQAPIAKTAEQIAKEAAANITKGEIQNQKNKVDLLKAQGKETLKEQLALANLELKLLQQSGQATTQKETEIEGIKTQIKQKAAKDRADLLKDLAEKEKKAYEESVAALEASYNKEKATYDQQLQLDLASAKSVEEKVNIQKAYATNIKTLDDKLVTDKFAALAKLQKFDKLNETQEKEKSAQLTNIQTDYNKTVEDLDGQLAELNNQRLEAEKQRNDNFTKLNEDAAQQDLENLQKSLQGQLDVIDESTTEGIQKAEDFQKKLLAVQKGQAVAAETSRSAGIIADLTSQLNTELKLYEGNAEKQAEIKKKYDDQITLEQKQSLENQAAIDKEYADKTIKLEEDTAAKKKEIADAEAEEKKKLQQDVFDKSVELANALADLAQALLEIQTKRIEEEYEKRKSDQEKLNDKLLSNEELTAEQRAELERQNAVELEKIEEDKNQKMKEQKKKQADIELAITAANIIAQTAMAVISVNASPTVNADVTQTLRGILTALVIGIGAAQLATAVAQRQAIQGLARGGMVYGAGGPTDDLVPIMASNGEAVINAAAVKRFGPVLSAINESTGGAPIIPRFAAGGIITATPGNVNVNNIQDIAAVAGQASVRAYILDADVTSQSVKNARLAREARIK